MEPTNTLDMVSGRFIMHGSAHNFRCPQFSDLAWKMIAPIYAQIKNHAFNQELAYGTLSPERFTHYLSQDALYLNEYNKTLNSLAAKLYDLKDKTIIKQFAAESLNEKNPLARPEFPTQATRRYINFLKYVGNCGSSAEIAAAVLPCFWIYNALGRDMLQFARKEKNPYYSWIQMYSAPQFSQDVEFMKNLNNRLAQQYPPFMTTRMLHLFHEASQMEYDFWGSAYTFKT